MTPTNCPPECQKDRVTAHTRIDCLAAKAIPHWLRTLTVTLIGVLFIFTATGWAYGLINYRTKEEAHRERSELNDRLTRMEQKIDILLRDSR